MSTYVTGYDGETKQIIFLIKDDKLLKKCNDIWNKVSNIIKKNLIQNPCTMKIFKKPN